MRTIQLKLLTSVEGTDERHLLYALKESVAQPLASVAPKIQEVTDNSSLSQVEDLRVLQSGGVLKPVGTSKAIYWCKTKQK